MRPVPISLPMKSFQFSPSPRQNAIALALVAFLLGRCTAPKVQPAPVAQEPTVTAPDTTPEPVATVTPEPVATPTEETATEAGQLPVGQLTIAQWTQLNPQEKSGAAMLFLAKHQEMTGFTFPDYEKTVPDLVTLLDVAAIVAKDDPDFPLASAAAIQVQALVKQEQAGN